ncbi:LOW QUALITY PROTEIN: kelch domain-containing protein 1-like [Neosynchiropus ocellatus]
MEAGGREAQANRLRRSGHAAFIDDGSRLVVWGGFQSVSGCSCPLPNHHCFSYLQQAVVTTVVTQNAACASAPVVDGEDRVLPGDEIWFCDLHTGIWECREVGGNMPSDLSCFCSALVNGTLYIFAGCDQEGYTNEMYSIDLTDVGCFWTKVTDTKGQTPSPRCQHSSWVHRDRIIYFGGYGCKTIGEARNTTPANFVVEEMSWATIGNTLFRCWGWNNEVSVFDTHSATWSTPETQGPAPSPRGHHASAVLGNRGYISGGAESTDLCLFSIDLDTWTWTHLDVPSSSAPPGRSMHTMTPVSDHSLFVYGGLSTNGNTLSDCWLFDTTRREWTQWSHPHKDKPRVSHTACRGNDNDVVVFGGSSKFCILMDSVAILRAPSPHHCSDVFIIQTQPYSLFRLCEDVIGRNSALLAEQLKCLPLKLRSKIDKRVAFYSAVTPTGSSRNTNF